MEIVEILSALRHCTSDLGCDTCPMRAGIEQRAFCVATLLNESKTAITDLLAGIDAAKRRCAQAQAERDALLGELRKSGCTYCKYATACVDELSVFGQEDCDRCGNRESCVCLTCSGYGSETDKWEWRGLPEAPEEGEKEDA